MDITASPCPLFLLCCLLPFIEHVSYRTVSCDPILLFFQGDFGAFRLNN